MKSLVPNTIAPPLARYAHGAVSDAGAQILLTSGQLGLAADGSIPSGTGEQAAICFANIDAILADAGATRNDVLRINAFVTDRAHMGAYMAARDAWLADVTTLPASTLVIVSGFTKPEFTVEIEVTAQVPQRP